MVIIIIIMEELDLQAIVLSADSYYQGAAETCREQGRERMRVRENTDTELTVNRSLVCSNRIRTSISKQT